MNESQQEKKAPRNAASWAKPVDKMELGEVPAEAMNLNVKGRRPTSPLQGFGQMWQKTYRIRLEDVTVTPQAVISEWKAHFPDFWPEGNKLYVPLTGIQPGEVGVINLKAPGGMRLSTGIMVIFADETSFSFMTPQGHMFAGMITFSADEEDGVTVVQIQALIRANDPLYELSFRLGMGHKAEDEFWHGTLTNLARHFSSSAPHPTQTNTLIDPRVQWSEWRNIWNNAGIRSGLYMPVGIIKKIFKRS